MSDTWTEKYGEVPMKVAILALLGDIRIYLLLRKKEILDKIASLQKEKQKKLK